MMDVRALALGLVVVGACAKGGIADPGDQTFGLPGNTTAMTAAPASGETATGETGTAGSGGADADDDADPDGTGGTSENPSGTEVGGELCGNGAIDPPEQCDGSELGGADCAASGFAGGTIGCNASCVLDTSGCVSAVCGDGVLGDGETCDCGGAACTPAQLGNAACTSLPAPSGGNYNGGALGCTAACALDETACTACGDGVIDAGETCDGANLGGQTCASQGFDAGQLSCSATCALATGSCVTYVCGNGACDPGEDSCSCAADCPDDPNTCGDPCECGLIGGNCYCDQFCLEVGDCCVNGPC